MQIGGDRPALGLRGVQRAVQQGLALPGRGAGGAHRAGEREVDELQQQQAAEQGRGELQPQPLAAGRDGAEGLVGLEQQRPVGRAWIGR